MHTHKSSPSVRPQVVGVNVNLVFLVDFDSPQRRITLRKKTRDTIQGAYQEETCVSLLSNKTRTLWMDDANSLVVAPRRGRLRLVSLHEKKTRQGTRADVRAVFSNSCHEGAKVVSEVEPIVSKVEHDVRQ